MKFLILLLIYSEAVFATSAPNVKDSEKKVDKRGLSYLHGGGIGGGLFGIGGEPNLDRGGLETIGDALVGTGGLSYAPSAQILGFDGSFGNIGSSSPIFTSGVSAPLVAGHSYAPSYGYGPSTVGTSGFGDIAGISSLPIASSRPISAGNVVSQHVTVTNRVAIPVAQPYPVPVVRAVQVPVPTPVRVPVDRPYPVPVLHNIPVNVDTPVPVRVDRPVPYPVAQPVPVPVSTPVAVPVPRPVPVPVYNNVAVPVPQPVAIQQQVPITTVQQPSLIAVPSISPSVLSDRSPISSGLLIGGLRNNLIGGGGFLVGSGANQLYGGNIVRIYRLGIPSSGIQFINGGPNLIHSGTHHSIRGGSGFSIDGRLSLGAIGLSSQHLSIR